MASANEIIVPVKVKIPDDTILRCIRLLEMWMDDNPDRHIICNRVDGENGFHHTIHIEGMVSAESE